MTRSLLLALALLAVPLMLAVRPALETQAEHEDKRLLSNRDAYPYELVPTDPRVLLRNVIKGQPIPVCSAKYPNATQEAIRRWEAALQIDAFVWKGAPDNCGTTMPGRIGDSRNRPQDGIGSIVVIGEAFPCTRLFNYDGCAYVFKADRPGVVDYDADWNTYYGKVEVGLNNRFYTADIGPTDALTDGLCRTFANDPQGTQKAACERLLATATHEFGHTLARPISGTSRTTTNAITRTASTTPDGATTIEEDEGAEGQHTCRTTSTGRLTTSADKPVRVFEGRFTPTSTG